MKIIRRAIKHLFTSALDLSLFQFLNRSCSKRAVSKRSINKRGVV